MDQKQGNKQKNNILKYLPRAASAVNFHSHQPFSPGRDHHHPKRSTDGSGYTHGKPRGFSGPFVSIIPEGARRRAKGRSNGIQDEDDAYVEPTSPKVSCMGQIKLKKEKMTKNKVAAAAKKDKTVSADGREKKVASKKGSSSASAFKKLFRRSNSDASSGASSGRGGRRPPVVPDKAVPSLGQMNKFVSGREGLKNFDWTAQIALVESDHAVHGKGYYSDEDDHHGHGLDSDSEEDEEMIIPFSAPIIVGGDGGGFVDLKPRKEINLWKRRTMNPPGHLQVD